MALVLLLVAGIFIVRHQQRAAQTSAPASVCAPMDNPTVIDLVPPLPPSVTLPVTLPAGEPRVVAIVNGDPLHAEGLELRVEGTLANNRQALQAAKQDPSGSLPPHVLAALAETPNQVRHDALTQLIQNCLLAQEGKRLGLTASLAAAQAMARQQLLLIHSLPASDPARARFETYLRLNHLDDQTFLTDPRILHGYGVSLTIVAVKQHIRMGLPPSEPPESGVSVYMQHLWQTGQVRVLLPAQLGW